MSVTRALDKAAHPDIGLLASKYSAVERWYDSRRDSYDFRAEEAVYSLSEAILDHYFGVKVSLSRNHLCPRIANRLDYVVWIGKIVEETELSKNSVGDSSSSKSGNDTCSLRGLDIGVGATCIYPVLGYKVLSRRFSFVGTDIDETSIRLSQEIIDSNGLADRISVRKVTPKDKFFDVVGDVTFTMCNPPFYSSREEISQLRKLKQEFPHSLGLSATDSELTCPGGEQSFVLDMFEQSRNNRSIQWFSTMMGKKSTLEQLVYHLKQNNVNNYALHRITHGSTRRWVVAWSFCESRPPQSLASDSWTARFNPPKTEFVLEASNLDRIREVLCSNQFVNVKQSTESLMHIHVAGDVWSRLFRRKRIKDVNYMPNCPTEFILRYDNGSVVIRWKRGLNEDVVKSFIGYVNRAKILKSGP
ncbi:hypothetical protein TRVA0_013S01046 [Trichomonascus vanleenenianus]|uniref:uncharacterized protein n=1 Tax=Trichomonascus vanleenenianus TaxID=2268995 RepID=UPI003EC9F51F